MPKKDTPGWVLLFIIVLFITVMIFIGECSLPEGYTP
jgi:hypothetical protein